MPQHCHPCVLFQLVYDNLYFVSDDIDISLQDSRHLFDSISRDRIAIPINRTLGHNDDVQSLRKETGQLGSEVLVENPPVPSFVLLQAWHTTFLASWIPGATKSLVNF